MENGLLLLICQGALKYSTVPHIAPRGQCIAAYDKQTALFASCPLQISLNQSFIDVEDVFKVHRFAFLL